MNKIMKLILKLIAIPFILFIIYLAIACVWKCLFGYESACRVINILCNPTIFTVSNLIVYSRIL